MKIYIGHPSSINYRETIYEPIRSSKLDDEHTIVLPHEASEEPFDSKTFLKEDCDLFVAEVSEASTGLGIELGWADLYEVPVICVCMKGSEPSGSISQVTDNVKSYQNSDELVEIIKKSISLE